MNRFCKSFVGGLMMTLPASLIFMHIKAEALETIETPNAELEFSNLMQDTPKPDKIKTVVTNITEAKMDGPALYEPMQVFAKMDGLLMHAKWIGDDGNTIEDISYSEIILDGRGFQSTHQFADGGYGGRAIYFYDEGKRDYIFHYFTTAGFHTTGSVEMNENGFTATEKVNGHDTIDEVHSSVQFNGQEMIVSARYKNNDGTWREGMERTYKPFKGKPPFLKKRNKTAERIRELAKKGPFKEAPIKMDPVK